MKAITIIQPWATLLALGEKRCETRSWKTNYRGEILLHASKRPGISGFIVMTPHQRIIAAGALGWGEFMNERCAELPTGAIVGKATLVNCVKITKEIAALIREQHPQEYALGDFTPGRYAWVMENAEAFKEPIPASGKQGLWNWEDER